MYRLSINDCSTSGRATIQDAAPAHSICHGNGAEVRNKTQKVTIKAEDRSIFGVTESRSSLGNSIEHSLKVGWRMGDHPQDVAGGRLPVEQPVALALKFRVFPNQLGLLDGGTPRFRFRFFSTRHRLPCSVQIRNSKHQIRNKRSQKHLKFGKSKPGIRRRLVLNLVANFLI